MPTYTRFDKMPVRNGRETIFLKETGHCRSLFKVHVRKLVNGLLNSHGGVIYFGVNLEGIITGLHISRKDEDEYRLAVDHTISKFLPLVGANLYRLSFLTLQERNHHNDVSSYKIIELKVSVGNLGDIYEDGDAKVFIMDNLSLIGPLHPQELRELILLKHKEAMEGTEEVAKFATPHLEQARNKVRSKKVSAPGTLFSVAEVLEDKTPPRKVVTPRRRIVKSVVNRSVISYDQDNSF